MKKKEDRIQKRKEAIEKLIETINRDDLSEKGLRDTPSRVAKSWEEFTSGYSIDIEKILRTVFWEDAVYMQENDPVILKDIRFESICEHHLLPIIGKAHIAYLPERFIVGISKLARVVEAFAKRLQIQERLTYEIADSIEHFLKPRGVIVVVEAKHFCIGTRGIHKPDSLMVTVASRGVYKHSQAARDEIMRLLT
jgi:GTP cyclohydrolase I